MNEERDFDNMTEEDWNEYIKEKYKILTEDFEDTFGDGAWEAWTEGVGDRMTRRAEKAGIDPPTEEEIEQTKEQMRKVD